MEKKETNVKKPDSVATAVVTGLASLAFLVLLLAIATTIFWHGVTGDVGGWTRFSLIAGSLGFFSGTLLGIFKSVYLAGKESR